MSRTNFKELLDAGVHFGHLKRKWNPNMAPYIFMEKNGIHIIDLQKTVAKIDIAASALKQIAKSGRKILFVATKKQAKDIVAERVKQINMPYVTERWPGGMLTNFPTIRKAVKKMSSIDKMATDGTFDTLSKRERLQIVRQKTKLEKNLGSIADLTRLPAALFIVDISKEHIAVREARRLGIPVFAIVDTNSNPNEVDFPIPANDDAAKSISLIVGVVATAIEEGLGERKVEREKEGEVKEKKSSKKAPREEEGFEDIEEEEEEMPASVNEDDNEDDDGLKVEGETKKVSASKASEKKDEKPAKPRISAKKPEAVKKRKAPAKKEGKVPNEKLSEKVKE